MSIFSFGNRKLPRSIAIFNLPRLLTCRNATELCKKVCYARKSERRFFAECFANRMRNYRLSLQCDFVDIMVRELSKVKQNKVRIHESGDFYSQTYLNKWYEIMRCFPGKTFTAYAKSILNYDNKPENFILIFSVDKTTTEENARWYYTHPKVDAIAHIGDQSMNCSGNCKKSLCLNCYNKELVRDIVLKQH